MVYSWNSNIMSIPQESQGIEIIRSIFHSINVNQHKFQNSLACSKLNPTKNLNKIVNDIGNRLELNSKAKSKFYYKNSYAERNIKVKGNITPAFQETDSRSSNTISEGNSNSDGSIDSNIHSDKVNLLWINDPKKFKSSNEKINSSINKNPTRTSVPFNQRRLEEIRQHVEQILTREDNNSLNKLPIDVNSAKDKLLLNINTSQQTKNEKYHQINLSINNYYQSSESSKNFKNLHEKIKQKSSSNTIKIDKQKTSFDFKNENIGKSKDELNIINNLNSSRYSESIRSKQLQTVDDSINKKINNSKSNPVKNKLSAVLTGQFKTAAKPSKMLIPQNSRGRAIFQSFMHMNDLLEEPEAKSIKVKSFKLKNPKANNSINPIEKSCGSNKISPRQNILSGSEKIKFKNKITKEGDRPPGQLLRSKTFIAGKKLDLPVNKEVIGKFETDGVTLKKKNHSEQINVGNIKNSRYSLIEEISSEEDYSCERIEVNKILKNNSNNKLNLLNDNENKEISINNDSINPLDKINACTETDLINCKYRRTSVDVKTSCDNLMSTNKKFINAQVFCNIPLIDTIKEETFEDLHGHKPYCIVDTQTSETLLLKYFLKEKKDASIETIKSKYQCKDTNTDKIILIDTATGKDRLDIQNFNCDSQSINTDDHFFQIPLEGFKITTHDFECQVNESTAVSVMSFEQVVSNLSSELISSQKSLLECTSKLSDYDIVSCGSLNNIPTEVIRAFKIAAERAQNLYQAYIIYQEYQQNKPKSDDNIVENSRDKTSLNATASEEIKSNYCIEKKFSNSEIQQIKFTMKNLLEMTEEKAINVNENKLKNYENEQSASNSSSSSSSSSSSITENVNSSTQSIISRKTILPIIYGTLCSFIFWSLQFSAHYEIN